MSRVPVGTVALLAVAALAAGPSTPLVGQSLEQLERVCMDCHPAMEYTRLEALGHADSISCRTCHHVDYVNDPAVVGQLRIAQCVSCHEDHTDTHTTGDGGKSPACTGCHSIHAASRSRTELISTEFCGGCHADSHPLHVPGKDEAPQCVDCHTLHAHTRPAATDPVSDACSACHPGIHPGHDPATRRPMTAAPDQEWDARLSCTNCHGPDDGFGLAPSGTPDGLCADCHDDQLPAHDDHQASVACVACHDFTAPLSLPGGEALMTERCARCHPGPLDSLRIGGHREGSGPIATPECVGCHASHGKGGGARASGMRIETTLRCIECHQEQADVAPGPSSEPASSYEYDFHGATVRFLALEGGGPEDAPPVMLCTDCHGAHAVALVDESELGPICGECHEGREDLLAGAWIGHSPVGPGNAIPVWLVRLFYAFLIPFMLGGLFLIIVVQFVDQKRKGARLTTVPGVRILVDRLKGREERAPTVLRFTRTERFEHLGSMVTFILLVVTGLPQTRPDLPVAQWLVAAFGGIWSTRLVHRVVGVAFVVLMVTHVARAIRNAIRRHRVPVMVPRRSDFEAVIQTFRHYLFGAPMPKVGKFDFAQKFEYWGLFLGAIVMSGSGLVLMFPELVTRLLPGIVLAAIRMMHGLEATFAVMVVVLWHSYGVILRPEIFPLDTTIFTGRMRVDRLRHEHALEYERLFPDEAGD